MLIHFSLNFNIDRLVDEINALLDSSLSIDINKNRATSTIGEET